MMIFVMPVQGKRVRHPEKKSFVIPDEGCFVENSLHWKRFIKFGDVVVVDKSAEENKESLNDKGDLE